MPAVISPVSGTRVEPVDGYVFMRGSTATFKVVFTVEDRPTTVDVATAPTAKILAPRFLSNVPEIPLPVIVTTLTGALVPGQQYEYQFVWEVPSTTIPHDEYIVSYSGRINGIWADFGDELFSVTASLGPIGIRRTGFCTVDDIRKKKFNIDDYLPKSIAADLTARNNLILSHVTDATNRLREELNLAKMRGNTENYRLFCIYYTIWSILLAARGEDGSSIADSNLNFWQSEWQRILDQEKRESVLQGIPLARG